MPALTSTIDPRSQDFQDNVAYHRALVDELDARLARAAGGGGDRDRAAGDGRLAGDGADPGGARFVWSSPSPASTCTTSR